MRSNEVPGVRGPPAALWLGIHFPFSFLLGSLFPACLPAFPPFSFQESFSMCPAQAPSHSSAFSASCQLRSVRPLGRIPAHPGCPAFSGTLASAPRCLVMWRVPLKGQSLKRRWASFTTLCSGLRWELGGAAGSAGNVGCQRVLLPSPGLSAASAACPTSPQLGWSQHSRRAAQSQESSVRFALPGRGTEGIKCPASRRA